MFSCGVRFLISGYLHFKKFLLTQSDDFWKVGFQGGLFGKKGVNHKGQGHSTSPKVSFSYGSWPKGRPGTCPNHMGPCSWPKAHLYRAMLSSRNIMQATYIILHFLAATVNSETGKINFNIFNPKSYHLNKEIFEAFHIIFFIASLWNPVCVLHLNSSSQFQILYGHTWLVTTI